MKKLLWILVPVIAIVFIGLFVKSNLKPDEVQATWIMVCPHNCQAWNNANKQCVGSNGDTCDWNTIETRTCLGNHTQNTNAGCIDYWYVTPTPTINPVCQYISGKWRLCHHNPSNNENLHFNDYHECDNHTGTPHNNEAYDTAGYCPVPTSTPTPTRTPTPTSTPTPIRIPTATPTQTPSRDKFVHVTENCDGTFTVFIYGGDTRRTWRVGTEEKWVERYTTVIWNNATSSVVEWKHDNGHDPVHWDMADEEYVTREKATDCESPIPIGNPACENVGYGCNGSPSFPHDQGTPTCTDGNTINLPANIHVIRSGTDATVTFFVTEGDHANIYYRELKENDWAHSVIGISAEDYKDNYISYTIHDLKAGVGYIFGIQQTKGCSGGQLVTAVVIDGPYSQTFEYSFWEWSR